MAKGNVTEQEKELMNELYIEIGTYAGVAREIGRSPSTIKRYILPDYICKADRVQIVFDEDRWSELINYEANFEDFMTEGASLQTEEEKKEMEELWQLLAI